MKKVLLFYIFERSGHHLAALAIEKAIRERGRGWELLTVNSLDFTNPRLNRVIQRSYLSLLRNTPEVWDYLYDNPKVARKIAGIKEFINTLNSHKLEELIDSFSPEAIICTQAFPCGVVAAYKKEGKMRNNPPLVGVITDYIAHCYWLYDQVDLYLVPHETTKQDMIKKGVRENKIRVTGIPVDPKFGKEQNRKRILERLSLSPSVPTILIMGGGQGLGHFKEVIRCLDALTPSLQMVIVSGLNKSLKKDLKKMEEKITKPVRILGYENNVDELMEISDIIVTKPGGMTTAEALTKGLAMVVAGSLPGQEENNVRFLVDNKVAIEADDGDEVAAVVDELLRNPHRLSFLKAKARELSRPDASFEVAKILEDSEFASNNSQDLCSSISSTS